MGDFSSFGMGGMDLDSFLLSPFKVFHAPNLKLPVPTKLLRPSPFLVFAAVYITYFIFLSGVIYDVITETPPMGGYRDPVTGAIKPQAILPNRINGQYIISGLLSVEGKKVLHLDRNDYYGGESASLNLQQLFSKFKAGSSPSEKLGSSRDYNVDLIPKCIMAAGELVKMFIKTDVVKYLEFKVIEGSYVYQAGKVCKVPATEKEALSSSLMGLLEKRRFKKFLEFTSSWAPGSGANYKGADPDKVSMRELFKKFSLDDKTVDFTGHAIALHLNDDYLDETAGPTLEKVRLYFESLSRHLKSPYIYPLYGLGELPQAFARLSAIYGGTYMLDMPVDEIIMEGGKAAGVRSGKEVAKAPCIIGDPSYFPDLVKKTGQVVRIICVLDHPIANLAKGADSTQIIVPQKQVGRNSD